MAASAGRPGNSKELAETWRCRSMAEMLLKLSFANNGSSYFVGFNLYKMLNGIFLRDGRNLWCYEVIKEGCKMQRSHEFWLYIYAFHELKSQGSKIVIINN